MASKGQQISYLFLGIVIGICLSAGALLGLAGHAPEYLMGLKHLLAGKASGESPGAGIQTMLDQAALKMLVQDILASEQGKALVKDLIQTQAPETIGQMLEGAMSSPEFRRALSEMLDSFFKTSEGKRLIKNIAKEIINP